MTRMVKIFLCIACLTLTACTPLTGLSDTFDRSKAFDRSVKAYNRMLRWHEIENAGMTYVDPAQREEYLKRAAVLKKRGLSVTDFRILSSRYLPEKKTGAAVAEFDYYILPSNKVKTISDRQEWIYREETKSWRLKSGLPPFE
ncbi:MAG: hypothetical protein PHH91_09885 [Desulfuromonadaceae bacterium]|nr:hypothetical protein [Desulfuromonadaceae bacterium]